MLILSWNSASWPSLLPVLPLSCFTCLFTHHIQNSSALLWNQRYSEKDDLPEHFTSTFFSCYAIFTWIWTFKTQDLTDYQFTVVSFLWEITFMWSDWQKSRVTSILSTVTISIDLVVQLIWLLLQLWNQAWQSFTDSWHQVWGLVTYAVTIHYMAKWQLLPKCKIELEMAFCLLFQNWI